MDIRVTDGWKEKPKITWDDNLSMYFLLFFLKPQNISEIIEFTNQRLEKTRQRKPAGKYEFFTICWLSLEENTLPQLVKAGVLAIPQLVKAGVLPTCQGRRSAGKMALSGPSHTLERTCG